MVKPPLQVSDKDASSCSTLTSCANATAETLGFVRFIMDLGAQMTGAVLTDALAKLSMLKSRGHGKSRHVNTNLLWIQDFNDEKTIAEQKSAQDKTLHRYAYRKCNADVIKYQLSKSQVEFKDGRNEIAYEVDMMSQSDALIELARCTSTKPRHSKEVPRNGAQRHQV